MTDFQNKLISVANMNEATKGLIDEDSAARLEDFTKHLLEVNKTLNLTAIRDEDGFIFLVDRKKDVIISGGENIYPVQIEDFLRNNNKIHDVAVIGIPDKRLGETTLAVIELKPDTECSEEEINELRKLIDNR